MKKTINLIVASLYTTIIAASLWAIIALANMANAGRPHSAIGGEGFIYAIIVVVFAASVVFINKARVFFLGEHKADMIQIDRNIEAVKRQARSELAQGDIPSQHWAVYYTPFYCRMGLRTIKHVYNMLGKECLIKDTQRRAATVVYSSETRRITVKRYVKP